MRSKTRSRWLRVVGVVMGLIVGGTLAFAQPAWAKKKPTFTCTGMTVNSTNNGTVSGCGGNTGGTGTISNYFIISRIDPINTVTITWANADTTSWTWRSAKGVKKPKGCPSGAQETIRKGTVTADTTGSTAVGATVKVEDCAVSSLGTFTLRTGTTLKL